MTTYRMASIRTASIVKDTEEKRNDSREKAMLLFTFQLLLDKGYVDTATALASECSLNLEHYTMCENIDLNSIFVDYEAYYSMRFQRHPQYFKKITNGGTQAVGESLLTKLAKQRSKGARPIQQRRGLIPEGEGPSNSDSCNFSTQNLPSLMQNEKLLKPTSGLDFLNEDMRYFADSIQKDIIVRDLETKWDDVIGLEKAKMVLIEAMVCRNEFTEFFGDSIPPWKGLLLYGPPGTGKTLLARAVSSETGTTFFNISSSSLVSKWRGDSEKIVKVLFELAKYHAPSTIFFDEFDAIASNRDTFGESDASRRLKSELLQQMDGLLSTSQPQLPIFILAATNLPWELDPAMVRRLEKRVYVPLPNAGERKAILKLNFEKTAQGIAQQSKGRNSLMCQLDFNSVANATGGYSGSDLQQLVKETVVGKFRKSFQDKSKLRKLVIDSEDISQSLQNVTSTVKQIQHEKFINWDTNFKAV